MKIPYQSNWFSGLLALLFALLLFFNANASGNLSDITGGSQVYDEMLYNIPVQLEYDQDKYFVSGYEETVNVHLSSANRIQLNLEANEDTRNFQVVADLTKTPIGTSEIQLRVKGLSTAVTAEIEPKTITVTVENKVTKSFDVEAQLPESIEAEGYKVEKIAVSPKTVEITTGEETAKAITRVIAPLSNVKQSVDTIKQTVNVQAIDSKGQVLSIENPAPQVKVVVDLTLPSKEVGLTISPTGSPPTGVENFTFNLSEQKVEIRGTKSVLDAIDTIELPVDISNIKSSTKQKIKIPTNTEYIVSPEEVEVTINPVFAGTSTSFSGTSGQGTTTSSSSRSVPTSVTSSEKTTSSSSTSSSSSSSSIESTTEDDLENGSSSVPAN
ncbi:CdaR family protein [Enterococcus sp. AZ177]|uniref:CdaR family protein n=1 Tax=unclassified Enterococcus TaxID=2608891 RepID=UPI003D2FB298